MKHEEKRVWIGVGYVTVHKLTAEEALASSVLRFRASAAACELSPD